MTQTSLIPLQRAFYTLATIILVVVSLYFARLVLLPIVMAVLLTFVLAPVVNYFQSIRLPRVVAVITVIALLLIILGIVFATVFDQLRSLGKELSNDPKNQTRIMEKVKTVQDFGKEIIEKITPPPALTPEGQKIEGEKTPVPVKMETSYFPYFQSILGTTLDFLVNAGLVLLLVIFMLFKKEDLRNRLVRLIGNGNLTGTIKVMDDTSQRISRFLLMQLIVNGTYGIALALGLFLIGVPYPFLWGFLGAVLRYVPYVGPWIAAVFPIFLAWAHFDEWTYVFAVVGYILVLELVSNNFMEPWLYGRSIGVSEVALLIAAAFWTWLWGPLGLVLSTPLTAVLVVFGRHFPSLHYFSLLLSDAPALEPKEAFFHRVLANDQDEAARIVEAYAKDHTLEEVYNLFIASFALLEKEQERGDLTPADRERFVQCARAILYDEVLPLQETKWAELNKEAQGVTPPVKVVVFGVPTQAEDELILEMFKEFTDPRRFAFRNFSNDMLFAEMLATIKKEQPAIIVVSCLPSPRSAQVRFLCKKIRLEMPDLKIVVGCWGCEQVSDDTYRRFQTSGADFVGNNFTQVAHQLDEQHPVLTAPAEAREKLVVCSG